MRSISSNMLSLTMSNNVAKILSYCVVIFATFLTTSCDSDNNGDGDSNAIYPTTSKALRLGVIPVDECLPIYVAEHLGLLDSLNADVKVFHYDALSECRTALANHKVDYIVCDSDIHYKLLTSKKSRLHRVSQLSEKVIAADGVGYSKKLVEQNIDSLLKLDRHIFVIKVEDLNVRTKMLISNNIDAAILPEPWASLAIKQGGAVLLSTKAEPNRKLSTQFSQTKNKKLLHAINTAVDSINKYGKENYYPLFFRNN